MLGNGAFPVLGTKWIDGHPLSEKDSALFPEVRKAYSNLHSMYIKHGDVASRNILVTNHMVELIDFAQAIIFEDKRAARGELDAEMDAVEALLRKLGATSLASADGIPLHKMPRLN
jgi:tRNA A-37 threonylcarbamoyl transferase component Bud32